MFGQLTVFDIHDPIGKRKPCEYSFQRYEGQRVKFWLSGEVGKIVQIEPYYTIVDTGKCLMAGTPTTICPADDS